MADWHEAADEVLGVAVNGVAVALFRTGDGVFARRDLGTSSHGGKVEVLV